MYSQHIELNDSNYHYYRSAYQMVIELALGGATRRLCPLLAFLSHPSVLINSENERRQSMKHLMKNWSRSNGDSVPAGRCHPTAISTSSLLLSYQKCVIYPKRLKMDDNCQNSIIVNRHRLVFWWYYILPLHATSPRYVFLRHVLLPVKRDCVENL